MDSELDDLLGKQLEAMSQSIDCLFSRGAQDDVRVSNAKVEDHNDRAARKASKKKVLDGCSAKVSPCLPITKAGETFINDPAPEPLSKDDRLEHILRKVRRKEITVHEGLRAIEADLHMEPGLSDKVVMRSTCRAPIETPPPFANTGPRAAAIASPGSCHECLALTKQVEALSQSLMGLGAQLLVWSSALHVNQRKELVDTVLAYTRPCEHVDPCLEDVCEQLDEFLEDCNHPMPWFEKPASPSQASRRSRAVANGWRWDAELVRQYCEEQNSHEPASEPSEVSSKIFQHTLGALLDDWLSSVTPSSKDNDDSSNQSCKESHRRILEWDDPNFDGMRPIHSVLKPPAPPAPPPRAPRQQLLQSTRCPKGRRGSGR